MQSYSTLKSKGTAATISGLKPATRYIFQVRARTSAGCGRFSQIVEVETGKPGECVWFLYRQWALYAGRPPKWVLDG